jgi:hypothetical protein
VSVEVKLTPTIGACYNYVNPEGREKRVSITISPIGLERRAEKTVISWACSMGATCRNPECRYSSAFKERTGQVPVAKPSEELANYKTS